MNKKTFNPYGDMRIDRVKAHHTYLKPRKEKMNNYNEDDEYAENIHSVPWEIGKIKNLCAGKPPPNLKKERIFDTMNDGKPIKKKKKVKKIRTPEHS
jgi:hypothetical protein